MTSYIGTIVSCFLVLSHFTVKEVYSLRDINIRVPEAVRLGDTVTLSCDYDLEKVALYTIKWYRYDEEFYRYVPKESPPSKVFIMPHINVDLPHSNSKEVTITHVDRETSGEYKCEVSADAPLFHTEIRAANLLVAEVPTHDVLLVNETQKVAPGGKVKVNCTTPSSYPAMNVTWYINDVQVHPRAGVHIDNAIRQYESLPGLDSVTSTLSLRAQQDFFHLGKMRVRCTGTLFALYNSSQEIEVQEDAPSMALVILPTRSNNDGINQGFRLSSSSNLLSSISSLAIWLTWFIAKAIYH